MTRINRILTVGCAILTLAAPVMAEDHRLRPEFTFKRVGVPQSGSGPRINVQIGLDSNETTTAAAETEPATTRPASRQAELAWFWTTVSPDLSENGPGRLETALTALSNPPDGVIRPRARLQTLQDIASAHGVTILTETIGTRVSPALVLSVIAVESAGRSSAESHAGAQGLMQLMPATAERFGVSDSLDPAQNIAGGVAYLDWLMGEFNNDPILVLAAYNAGEGAVRRASGVPNYAETRDYVPKVLNAWTLARGLCVTPPELVSDGCVFVVSAQ